MVRNKIKQNDLSLHKANKIINLIPKKKINKKCFELL